MVHSSSSLLDTLPARPPTPPKDLSKHIDDALAFLDADFTTLRPSAISLLPKSTLDTPPDQSPSSSAEQNNTTSSKRTKRVGFSAWHTYGKAPAFGEPGLNRGTPPSSSLPHREPRFLKSILKPRAPPPGLRSPTRGSLGDQSCSTRNFGSFAEMLESIIHQLAGQARDCRLDAYVTMLGTLKAYEDIPDVRALESRMSLFTQFIQRDICAVNASTEAFDTVLITQALKLLTTFMRVPSLMGQFDHAFCTFIVGRSILILNQSDIPKAIVNHHLYVLAQQDFDSRVWTSERAGTVLDALQDIDERVKGNGVIGSRLAIYKNLVERMPSLMVARITDWLPHVFHGMLSSIKDVRTRAIDTGLSCALTLGTYAEASGEVMDLLSTEAGGGINYGVYLERRLQNMLASKDDGQYVPQIWSVVILFLRSRRHKLSRWRHLKLWLDLIQKCFNAGDMRVKSEGNLAWNRLVFVVSPDVTTQPAMINLLRQGIAAQLDRKGGDKYSNQAKQIALSSYNNLLYYAFRPSAPASQLDLFWDEYVVRVLDNMTSPRAKDGNTACRILTALSDGSKPISWIEDRANQPKAMKLNELPSLDPRWIRQRLSKILKLVSLCVTAASWSPSAEKEAPVQKMWTSLMTAVSEASNKEITTSVETREAIAHVTNFLHCQWSDLTELQDAEESPLLRFGFLVQTAVEKLGPMHFAERNLLRTAHSAFEAAPTPSHRSRNTARSLQSPMLHLLELLLYSTSAQSNPSCVALANTIVLPCWSSRNTRQLKFELLKDCAQLVTNAANQQEMRYEVYKLHNLPQSDTRNGYQKSGPATTPLKDPGDAAASDISGPTVLSQIWQVLAELAESTLEDSIIKEGEPPSNRLGHEYQAVVEILGSGLRFSDYQSLSTAKSLHNALVHVVGRELGDGAVPLAVTEPLAERVVAVQSNIDRNGALIYGAFILEQARHPRSRRDLERARKALPGEGIGAVQKLTEFDPYDSLYSMITGLASESYQKMHCVDPDMIVCFLSELARYVTNYPLSLLGILLRKIQAGVALWIEDSEGKLENNAGGCHELSRVVADLWTSIASAIGTLPRKGSVLLRAFETLILAGFRSRRRAIVDPAVALWNATFGLEQSLGYPSSIARALRRLRATVELQLPDFPAEGENEEAIDDSAHLLDSQDGETEPRPVHERQPTVSPNPHRHTPNRQKRHDFETHIAAVQSSPASEMITDSQDLPQHDTQRGSEAPVAKGASADIGPRTPVRSKDKAFARFTINLNPPTTSIDGESTTPRLPVTSEGVMDDVPSSSPTPASVARRQIRSDDTEMATPIAVRSARFDALPEGPPSSPPAPEEDVQQGNDHAPGHAPPQDQYTILNTGNVQFPINLQNAPALAVSADEDYGPTIVLSSADPDRAAEQLAAEALACLEGPRDEETPKDESPVAVPDVSFSSRVEQTPIETINSDVFVDARSEHVSGDSTEEVDVFVDASQVPLPPSTDSDTEETEHNEPRPDLELTNVVPVTAEEEVLNKSSPAQQMAAEAGQSHLPPVERVENSFILSDRGNSSRAPSQVSTEDPGNMGDRSRKRGRPSTEGGRSGKRLKKHSLSQAESLSSQLPSQYTENEEMLDCIVIASQSIESTLEPPSPRIKPEPSPSPTKSRRSAPPSASKPHPSRVPDSAAVADSQPVPGPFSSRKRLLQATSSTASPVEDTSAPKCRKVRPQKQRDTPRATGSSTSDLDDLTGHLAHTRVLSHVEIRTLSSQVSSTAQGLERQDVVAHDDMSADSAQPIDDETTMLPPETPATPSRNTNAVGASSTTREDVITPSNPPTPSSSRLGRTILHPRSILERLKKILTDCQQMVLGSQEEREIDDVLFEVRKEVHEAGQRGRGG